MKHKINYLGDDLLDLEIRLIYEDFDESLHSIVGTIDNDDETISFLMYEDYRMGNNPFSSINYFPEDISFSFEKIFMDKTNIQNLWEIKIPKRNIKNVAEIFEDESFWHEYNIKLKNDTLITITGRMGWFSEEGALKTFDISEINNNIFLTQNDVFNQVKVFCKTTLSEYKIIYFEKEIARFKKYLEIPKMDRFRAGNLKRIEDLKKILAKLKENTNT